MGRHESGMAAMRQILAALGIDPAAPVTAVDVRFEVRDLPRVTVHYLPTPAQVVAAGSVAARSVSGETLDMTTLPDAVAGDAPVYAKGV